MAPGELRMFPVTPSLPLPPIPTGQLTELPLPTFDCHSELTADRYVVKIFVVPLLSARCATMTGSLGICAPGLSLVMAGSCQLLIVPRKMAASACGESFSGSFRPGRL